MFSGLRMRHFGLSYVVYIILIYSNRVRSPEFKKSAYNKRFHVSGGVTSQRFSKNLTKSQIPLNNRFTKFAKINFSG